MRARSQNLLFAIIFVIAAASAVWADAQRPTTRSRTPTRVQTRTYTFRETGTEIDYALFVPTTYKSSKPAPLIIALHGFGANPMSIMRYQGLTQLAEARGYIVAAPMGYSPRGWYGSMGKGRGLGARGGLFDGGAGEPEPENLGELSEMDVMNVLGLVREDFNVDASRIYLFGHSMGGGGTWHLGIRHADIWAALAPASPAIFTSPNALEGIKEMPVIVVQGDADRLVNVNLTRPWIAKMKALGMTYEYIEVPGGDHMSVIARSPQNMRKIFDFFDRARKAQ